MARSRIGSNTRCKSTALSVMEEAATTAYHGERVTYAKTVLIGTALILEVAIGFLNNPAIASVADITLSDFGIADSNFDFVIATIYNAFAGISAPPA